MAGLLAIVLRGLQVGLHLAWRLRTTSNAAYSADDDDVPEPEPLDEPLTRVQLVRSYVGSGTGVLFVAVALVLAGVGIVTADPRIWRSAITIFTYLIVARAVLIGALLLVARVIPGRETS